MAKTYKLSLVIIKVIRISNTYEENRRKREKNSLSIKSKFMHVILQIMNTTLMRTRSYTMNRQGKNSVLT